MMLSREDMLVAMIFVRSLNKLLDTTFTPAYVASGSGDGWYLHMFEEVPGPHEH